jgi:hypothetical protein
VPPVMRGLDRILTTPSIRSTVAVQRDEAEAASRQTPREF